LEIRQGSLEGPLLGSLKIDAGKPTDVKNAWKELQTNIEPANRQTDIFLVFKNPDKSKKLLFYVDWMYFDR